MQTKGMDGMRTPLVLVPGVFGSMSDVILPGTGGWSFGLAGDIYEPFLELFKRIGYVRDRDLFIAYYDWRQRISFSAYTYLAPMIQEAKLKTGADQVNLVCHSMGGLVARAYVQSGYYRNDVDQLIMLGTPNAGSPVNYCYWMGGTLEYNAASPHNAVSLAMYEYLHYVSRGCPGNPIAAIRAAFPSLVEVVPSCQYGDYLLVNGHASMRLIPYPLMPIQNDFLHELDAYACLIFRRHIRVTIIAGIGSRTAQYLHTADSSDNKIEKSAIWSTVNSDAGDGNVMVHSALALEGEKHVIAADHVQLLLRSAPLLVERLALPL
ncbi:acetyltransferase [Paenibacillus sp. MER 180]|uniref:esterase/lipase family protein n=1 Tax=Paenibacillus sp. MER 180 TaxID=2939570 RepID=UPI00203E83CA|nr:acetyltransferase [Paenibacillus sp. MER 180]MCM3288879.1 acetyltransferase [Paenibacillus sp. MER 180]